VDGAGVDGADIGQTLFSARSFDEYRAMFALTGADLAGPVLDCPGGAASFTAEATERGARAFAVDPLYARDPVRLAGRAHADAVRGNEFLRDPVRTGRFVWTYFRSPDEHLAARTGAAGRFGTDIAAHPDRYVAAALPYLPFPDRTFDLVLSSHLLFTYGERLDPAFHLAALRELCRVARRAVRVFPLLLHTTGAPYPELDPLRRALAGHGIDSELRRVPYELQRGGDHMLVLAPAAASAQEGERDPGLRLRGVEREPYPAG
jgi:SAM-dependent methyltransferase